MNYKSKNDKMSSKPNKFDTNCVSQRVQQTKKEIEQLKLELQKLINRGIETEKSHVSTITLAENEDSDFQNTRDKFCIQSHPTCPKNVTTTEKLIASALSKQDGKIVDKARETSSRKIRHYNVEEARDYIKKQKEKRQEEMKIQINKSKNEIDIRKEKLKELQKKSLELVQKNVNFKRERSCSRERIILQRKPTLPTEDKKNILPEHKAKLENIGSSNFSKEDHLRIPDLKENNAKTVPSTCSNKSQNVQQKFDFKNICIRNEVNDKLVKFNDLLNLHSERHHKAAIKIQSYYRGYCHRKYFKKIVRTKKKKANIPRKIKPTANIEIDDKFNTVSVEPPKVDVPFWLQTTIQPYPYNFISAVKRKLNLTVNTPIKTNSDIGIQISLDEPQKNDVVKTRHEIKKALVESTQNRHTDITSFISHKCGNLNLKSLKKLHVQDDKFHNLNSDCDIKEYSENLFLKQKHSKNEDISLLESETTDSDTSKNIPDISSEGSLHSKNDSINMSEYKLEINVDKLKSLKLKDKKLNMIENTMDILNDNIHMPDKIPLQEVPQIVEYLENSSNMKTENVETDLGSNFIPKSKSLSHRENNQSKSNNSTKYNSVNLSLDKERGSTNSIPFIFDIKSYKLNNAISRKISSENCISDVLYPKMNNASSSAKTKTESDLAIILNERKANKSLYTEIEPDENLKSFLDYMSSMQESKKSRKGIHQKSSNTKTSNSFESLLSRSEKSSESLSHSKTANKNLTEDNYSSNFSSSTSSVTSSVPLLKRPSVTLTTSEHIDLPIREENKNTILIQPGEVKCIETKTNTNQIHLKFEAELHLLNDFNESLRQFMAVEKSLIELQSKSQHNITVYQNQDTQTTIPIEQTSLRDFPDNVHNETTKLQASQRIIPTINYSRGSDIVEELDSENRNITNDDKSIATGLELSHLNESTNSSIHISVMNTSVPDVHDSSFTRNAFAGFSVGMFDQLIKDEDARIENLKTILKIREKALLDRTKGELAWLEIQKKHLIETGQLHQASLLKKKQRGIIIKLQHEKQEMQRLKQIQKAASKERKTILKEQRNMIKAQLSNNTSLPKIRRSLHKGRRSLGPIKVYNLRRDTINTETSISRKSSVAEEIIITSRSDSIISQISEKVPADQDNSMILNTSFKSILSKKTEEAKKSLLMREAALQKRRKAAEDLLQWHQRLLEEERKITELEMAANIIIKQVPVHTVDNICKTKEEKFDFKGSQLNSLWTNITGIIERKFEDEEIYTFNQLKLEKFCKDAINSCGKDKHFTEISEKNSITCNNHKIVDKPSSINGSDYDDKSRSYQSLDISQRSVNESIRTDSKRSVSSDFIKNQDDTNSYSSEFNTPEVIETLINQDEYHSDIYKSNSSVHTEILVNEIDKSKSTLNEIMQNISNITDEISVIYKLSSVANTIKDESIPTVVNTSKDNTSNKIKNIYSQKKEIVDTENFLYEDTSEDDTLKSSLQSEIVKSLTELISSQNPCQDIKSEQKLNIIETPESVCSKNILTDSQGTLEANSELCTNSNKVKYEVNKLKDNEESDISSSNNLSKELFIQELFESNFMEHFCPISKNKEVILISNKSSDSIEDLQKENNQSVDTDKCSNIVKSISNVSESQNQDSENTLNAEISITLDLSYGFTGVRINNKETPSFNSDNITVADQTSEMHSENEYSGEEVQINSSSNHSKDVKSIDVHETTDKISENLNEHEVETKATYKSNSFISEKLDVSKSVLEINVSNDFNKSAEETTVSTRSDFEQSISVNEINNINENQEQGKSIVEYENLDVLKLSSPVEASEFSNNNGNLINKNLVINGVDLKSVSETVLNKSELSEDVYHEKCIKDFGRSTSNKNTLKIETCELVSDNEIHMLNSIPVDEDMDNRDKLIVDNTLSKLPVDNFEELDVKNHVNNVEMKLDKSACNDNNNILEISKSNDKITIFSREEEGNTVDVKKRVSEILADTNIIREDKSPRLQDIYTTTYDILSPENSPEIGSPVANEKNITSVTQLFDEEAEALFKKQLAIEQEIKQLEQQQKEHIPYIYMREIPNKPPPPYTPPATVQIHITSVLPSSPEHLQSIISLVSETLFKAYENGSIENAVPIINDELQTLNKINVDKECYEFIFDLCKEFAVDHYKQFIEETGPSWTFVNKKPLATQKPLNRDDLKDYLSRKVKEIFGFEKTVLKENMITKWSRKKRDHVDELLIIESQTEESEWTNYDDDEIIVKNELTNDIMNMLLTETANVISKIFTKKMGLS